jgi:hypothetical protein
MMIMMTIVVMIMMTIVVMMIMMTIVLCGDDDIDNHLMRKVDRQYTQVDKSRDSRAVKHSIHGLRYSSVTV